MERVEGISLGAAGANNLHPGAPDINLAYFEQIRAEAFVTGISENVPEGKLKDVIVQAFQEGAREFRGLDASRK